MVKVHIIGSYSGLGTIFEPKTFGVVLSLGYVRYSTKVEYPRLRGAKISFFPRQCLNRISRNIDLKCVGVGVVSVSMELPRLVSK
jgi:hypothetical protein